MAAPTSVTVESTSPITAVLRWVYGGSTYVDIYRSTDGVTYARISIVPALAVGTLTYTDYSLTGGTKYWYKLTDDDGSTFSTAVSVWTHACPGDSSEQVEVPLPRFMEEQVEPEKLNEMARRIEDAFGSQQVIPPNCVTCPSDGAVVIDCSNGCQNWTVIADQDIKSWTVNWCNDTPGEITVIIPPNVTRSIGGFPAGSGFSGNEGTDVAVVGGTTGRTVTFTTGSAGGGLKTSMRSSPGTSFGSGRVSGTNSSTGRGGGGTGSPPLNAGGGGGAGGPCCPCVTQTGALKIQACTPNNSLNCASQQGTNYARRKLYMTACGGVPPYAWSKTGSVLLSTSIDPTGTTTARGVCVIATPPTNSGSSLDPTTAAYHKYVCFYGGSCASCDSPHYPDGMGKGYNCNDDVIPTFLDPTGIYCGENGFPGAVCGTLPACAANTVWCIQNPPRACEAALSCLPGDACDLTKTVGSVLDTRSAGMISGGCVPCGLVQGSTISVTDALGVVATITIRS